MSMQFSLGLSITGNIGKCSGLRTLGGTPNGDPCSFWGLIWGLPGDIGVYNDYIRVISGNGIEGPY